MMPQGSFVTVELLYRDGRPARIGRGQVTRLRAPPQSHPGMHVRVAWRIDAADNALRAPVRGGASLRSPRQVVPQTSDLVLDPISEVPPLFGPGERNAFGDRLGPAGQVPPTWSATQIVIERARNRPERSTTYEGAGPEKVEFVKPSALAGIEDATRAGRGSSLARIEFSDAPEELSRALEAESFSQLSAPPVGIDFSAAAVRVWACPDQRSTDARALTDLEAAIYLPQEDRPLVGVAAEKMLADHPERGLSQLSHLLGVAFTPASELASTVAPRLAASRAGRMGIRVDGRIRSVEELAAWLLVEARVRASESLGGPVRSALIACPVNYGLAARQELRRAAERAGLDVLGIVRGPTAVARVLLGSTGRDTERSLIVDLGSTTVDVAVVEAAPEVLRVVGQATFRIPEAIPPADVAVRSAHQALRQAGVKGTELDAVVLLGTRVRDASIKHALVTRVCRRVVDLEDAEVIASGTARLAREWGAPGASRVFERAPGAVWLVDDEGKMHSVVPNQAEWPATGRTRHRIAGGTGRLFVAEELEGELVPVAEVRVEAATAEPLEAEVELSVHGHGAVGARAINRRTGVALKAEVVPSVSDFFDVLRARPEAPR